MRTRETVQNAETQTEQVAEAPQIEGAAPGSHEPQTKDERHERIKDYLRSALAMKDPLAANVGAVNSDLMLFGYSLQRAITKALDMTPAALDEFGKLMPAIDSYMRISRQVERFAKLNQQLANAEKVRQVAKQVRHAEGVDAASEEIAS
jgi:hypothetical protein